MLCFVGCNQGQFHVYEQMRHNEWHVLCTGVVLFCTQQCEGLNPNHNWHVLFYTYNTSHKSCLEQQMCNLIYVCEIFFRSCTYQWLSATDTAKITGPRILADKRWVGPVKLLCIVMFDISKIRPKSILGRWKPKSFCSVWCKTAVTPVHYQWSYCSLALSHWYNWELLNFYQYLPCGKFYSNCTFALEVKFISRKSW